MKFCIDAGHGGNDPGAGKGQYMEKTYALSMALKLGARLSALGHEVVYTRRSDAYISLSGRCQTANEHGSEIFISIHLNASANPAASGIETYCYGMSGKGFRLAECVQKAMIRATGETDRGVKDGKSFAVIRGTKMPAILIETGFISNYHDLKKLITVEHQNALVDAMVSGIREYMGEQDAAKTESAYALTAPNDIVWQLGEWGLVDDPEGMLREMEENPDGRLYHFAKKCVNRMLKAS